MAKSRIISVRSPIGGIDRSADYQSEPPFTCFDALDVLPFDAKTMRDRCAVRPGWAVLGSPTINSANLLATLALAPSETKKRQLLTAADGTLYAYAPGTNTWTTIGTGITTGRHVMAVSYLQKLYIANDGTPKVYNYSGGTITSLTASDGTVPTNCRIVLVWDDRLCFADDPSNPHILYLGRQGDPTSWLFAEEDAGSAVASSQIEGGLIREPITACIPHDNQCLIVSGSHSMSVFRGNPMSGGRQIVLTHLGGITNRTAWCKTPSGATYMLTHLGLGRMAPGCGSIPDLASDRIPDELRVVDGITYEAYLMPDPLFRLIHIHVTGPTPQYWLYDTKNKGFWRATPPGESIGAMHWYPYVETKDASGALVATASGIKRLDRTVALGGASPAFMTFNPIRIGGPLGGQSVIHDARFAFGENTNDTTGTVEIACARDGYSSSQMAAGYKSSAPIGSLAGNRGWHPRVGNQAATIKITQGDTTKHWSLEDATITVLPCGLSR